MLLCIRHHTHYRYEHPVRRSQHLARLRPRQGDGQTLRNWHLTIAPEPDWRSDDTDCWGNPCTRFDFERAHDTLDVWADAVVHTTRPIDVGDADVPWTDVRAAIPHFPQAARRDPSVPRRSLAAWVQASPHIPLQALRDAELRSLARECFAPDGGWLHGCRALAQRLHREWMYAPGSTKVDTPVLDVLARRRGVCQDFAHLMIAALRALGLPAQYVSGYLLTHPPAGQRRAVGADASHGWVAVPWQDGWYHLDPTNACWGLQRPSEGHVILAVGRDYADVAPLGGVLHGGGQHTPVVQVTVAAPEEWTALGLPPLRPADRPLADSPSAAMAPTTMAHIPFFDGRPS
ncbi:transglutaminase family protein [Tepidimonas sp.]|uniref:transglutaminase family protein n=1 Tax=Tepidimonas sp. TaxID=2002775 RepID=UPI002FE0E915